MNDQKADDFVQALLDDRATFEEVNRRIEIARHALIRLAKESPNTFNYLCRKSDVNYTLFDALETLGNTAYQLSLEEKARVLDTPESQPVIKIRRVTWMSELEKIFTNCALAFLASSAVLGSVSLSFWGISQAQPNVPQFQTATNTTKGLAIAAFGGVLFASIGGGIAGNLSDMKDKEND